MVNFGIISILVRQIAKTTTFKTSHVDQLTMIRERTLLTLGHGV